MARLLLRGIDLGEVRAVLFDKDGTLSISEPQLITLAQARVFLCLEQVEPRLHAPLQRLLLQVYGLQPGGGGRCAAIAPAGITAVASREHNLIATATALVQLGLGWPEALAISERTFERADGADARRASATEAQPSCGAAAGAATEAPATSATTEGLHTWLEQLRAAELPCAVISNDDVAGIEHFLRSHGLRDHFQAVWSAEHRPRKPDPAAVHGVCGLLGVEAAHCALIGDANSDLQMAVAAGIPQRLALGYTAAWSTPPPLAEPHPQVHHWRDLALVCG
ncbi:MAG: HAD family hydrolase [Cyanobium sp.]